MSHSGASPGSPLPSPSPSPRRSDPASTVICLSASWRDNPVRNLCLKAKSWPFGLGRVSGLCPWARGLIRAELSLLRSLDLEISFWRGPPGAPGSQPVTCW